MILAGSSFLFSSKKLKWKQQHSCEDNVCFVFMILDAWECVWEREDEIICSNEEWKKVLKRFLSFLQLLTKLEKAVFR